MSLLTSSTLPSCRSRHHRSMAPLLIDATSLGPSVLPLPDHSLVSISVPPPPPVRILSHRGYPMSKTPAPAARSKQRVSEHRIEVEYFLGVDQLHRNIVRASDRGVARLLQSIQGNTMQARCRHGAINTIFFAVIYPLPSNSTALLHLRERVDLDFGGDYRGERS